MRVPTLPVLTGLITVTLSDGFAFQDLFSSFTKGLTPSSSASSIQPIPSNVRLLILPGFGNDARDYYLDNLPTNRKDAEQSAELERLQEVGSLVKSLQKRGWTDDQIRVLPVQRSDWLQVFWRGALDPQFWQGTMPPTRPPFAWYLNCIAQNIRALTQDKDDDNSKVVLVCHSAGGWLARAALGFGSQASTPEDVSYIDLQNVLGIVTLGTPQTPPPDFVMDMTRGALRITHETFPGAYHASNSNNNDDSNNLFYISVVGEAVTGVKQERRGPMEPTSVQGFAYNSYEAVCGIGTTIGDGVVPTCSAHIDGADKQITLEGVFHSINAPEQWYGSDSVIDSWHDDMLLEIQRTLRLKSLSSQSALQRFPN